MDKTNKKTPNGQKKKEIMETIEKNHQKQKKKNMNIKKKKKKI